MSKHMFVGDLHGSIKALKDVLGKVKLTENDYLFFTGDYVDKGRNSKEVLEKLYELYKSNNNVYCVLGNHDKYFLDFIFEGDTTHLKVDPVLLTIKSYYGDNVVLHNDKIYLHNQDITDKIRKELSERSEICLFLKELPLSVETKNHVVVHANIDKSENYSDNIEEKESLYGKPNITEMNKTGKYIVSGHVSTSNFVQVVGQSPIICGNNHYLVDTDNYIYDKAKVLVFENNVHYMI